MWDDPYDTLDSLTAVGAWLDASVAPVSAQEARSAALAVGVVDCVPELDLMLGSASVVPLDIDGLGIDGLDAMWSPERSGRFRQPSRRRRTLVAATVAALSAAAVIAGAVAWIGGADDRPGSVEAIPGDDGSPPPVTEPTVAPDPTVADTTAPPETTQSVPVLSPLEAILAEAGEDVTLVPVNQTPLSSSRPATALPLFMGSEEHAISSDEYVGQVPGTEVMVRRIDADDGGTICVALEALTVESPGSFLGGSCASGPPSSLPGTPSWTSSEFPAYMYGRPPEGAAAVLLIERSMWARPVKGIVVFPVAFLDDLTLRYLDHQGVTIGELNFDGLAGARRAAEEAARAAQAARTDRLGSYELLPEPARPVDPGTETGKATWYDFAPVSGGCAHRTLPKGTVVTVTNNDNGKSVTCTVNDRGPYGEERIIGLHPDQFSAIAELEAGVVIDVTVSW